MEKKLITIFGLIGPLLAYLFIFVSISLSPWFSWQKNALSDLGHSVISPVAPLFNTGLLLTGFLITIFAITVYPAHAKYTSLSLVVTSFLLQLVAAFDEVYGTLHWVVSVLFFLFIGITSIVYAIEKKSVLGLFAFIVGLSSWILYGLNIFDMGIAVPEILSSLPFVLLLVSSTIQIYLQDSQW